MNATELLKPDFRILVDPGDRIENIKGKVLSNSSSLKELTGPDQSGIKE